MQQVDLPPWLKVPGVVWVVLLVGVGVWAYYNTDDPVLFQMIAGGIAIALRLLVNNDKALEQAADAGQTLLDYIFRQPKPAVLPPTVSETGKRGVPTLELTPVEPIPSVKIQEPPNKWLSVLFG